MPSVSGKRSPGRISTARFDKPTTVTNCGGVSTSAFTAADAGVHTFSVRLLTAGGTTFAVQDAANAANPAFNYSQRDITVTPAAFAGIAITAPSNVTAGVAFNMQVLAVDAFGNVVAGYTGKIHFSGPSGIPGPRC